MPKTKSAKKALRQSIRRRKRNLARKRGIEKNISSFRRYIQSGNIGEAEKSLALLYKLLDKAAKNNLIKKGAVRRKKAKLARMLTAKKQ